MTPLRELIILLGAAAAIALAPGLQRASDRMMHILERLARVAGGAVALTLVFLLVITICAVPVALWGAPLPSIHDEFAYLLAGDTFAHGRLTNPPPPADLAPFFETYHVLVSPTYMAKFPPGQGAALAVGFWLHLPIAGAWITMGLACTATAWMLAAAMPRRWALLGGLLCAVHPVTFWWGASYWGGGVAMLGGALLIGAALRAAKVPRCAWGLLLGAGLAVLANSRPLEGLVTSILLFVWLSIHVFRTGTLRAHLARTILPATIILMPTLAFMLYYNWRITGDAMTTPYALHHRQYMVAPLTYYRAPAASRPAYHHPVLEEFHGGTELNEYYRQLGRFDHAPSLASMAWKWDLLRINFLWPWFVAVPLVAAIVAALPRRWRRRRCFGGASVIRLAWFACLSLPILHMLITPWFRPTYVAPVVPLYMLLLTAGLRALSRCRIPSRGNLDVGRYAAQVVALAMIANLPMITSPVYSLARSEMGIAREDRIVRRWGALPGRFLVLARYAPGHNPLAELVYNGADLRDAKLLFARSMGPQRDKELIAYYPDRTVVVVDFDDRRFDDHRLRARQLKSGESPDSGMTPGTNPE